MVTFEEMIKNDFFKSAPYSSLASEPNTPYMMYLFTLCSSLTSELNTPYMMYLFTLCSSLTSEPNTPYMMYFLLYAQV